MDQMMLFDDEMVSGWSTKKANQPVHVDRRILIKMFQKQALVFEIMKDSPTVSRTGIETDEVGLSNTAKWEPTDARLEKRYKKS